MSYYGIRPVNRSCGSYGPGHQMHWIQAKKSHEDGQPIIKVNVVAVHDDGRVEIEGRDLKLTLWYHDPDHLRSALCFGGRAEWKPKYHVLYVISSGSFNLATLDKVEPCKRPIRRRPTGCHCAPNHGRQDAVDMPETTPWRDRGDYYILPKNDPLAALNILREAAGLEPLPDDENLPPDHGDRRSRP